MPIEQQLKEKLAQELCAILGDGSQWGAAMKALTNQSEVSRLRHGQLHRFSVGRLCRLIGNCHYNIDVHLRAMPRVYGTPHVHPAATVSRYDRYGRVVAP